MEGQAALLGVDKIPLFLVLESIFIKTKNGTSCWVSRSQMHQVP